jgi:hypothetical protein
MLIRVVISWPFMKIFPCNHSVNININVPIEVMIFIFYSDEIAIDVTTGLVTRHKN